MELAKEDYLWLEKMTHLTELIDEVYKNLYECEFCDDSINFQKNLQHLQILIEEERKRYFQLWSNFQKIPLMIESIVNSGKIAYQYADIEAIVVQKMNDRVYRRIVAQLEYAFNFQFASCEDKSHLQFLLVLSDPPQVGISLSHELSYHVDMERAYQSDYYSIFLSLLNDYLKKKKDSTLMKTKYDVSFLNRDIETDMLESHFQINSSYFSRIDWNALLYRLHPNFYAEIVSGDSAEKLQHHIRVLLQLDNRAYEDENMALEVLLRSCFIRAALTMIDDTTFQQIKEIFEDYIQTPQYLFSHRGDDMTSNLVHKCFEKRKADRMRKSLVIK